MERGWKPNVEISPNCPRCGSSNTKFCYYNNYSLTQPRYFCKSCRRYWTKGGSLRNVPVGGGCRKNRRSKSLVPSNSLGFSTNLPNRPPPRMNQDGSQDIDLAVVFANFLNPKPDAMEGRHEKPGSKPSIDDFVASNPFNFSAAEENIGVFGSCSSLCEFSLQEYGCFGLESSTFEQRKIRVNGSDGGELELPPFPGEDAAAWTSSLLMANHRQDPNLVSGNWSPIDFSNYDTFSRA